ncbi:oligosaccharide flippase family protein [Candidatus Roizmanbacteria bacterium]|nr:oligosaccharide flippase family protein [Candidatus Roizmanbacteria bacterium]
MLERILGFIKKPTSRDILINTIGNYLNVFFTAFFYFMLVRIMGPADLGVLSVLLGIAYVLANILDFGTTASIYSYLPQMIEKKHKNLYIFLKTIISYQTGFSIIVITLLFIFFPYLDKIFFKTGAPAYELYITTFSVLFFIWQNYAINALNAAKQFLKANLFLNLANVTKTVIILILIPLKAVTVGTIIFTFGIIGPGLFFLLLFFEKKHIFLKVLQAPIVKEEFRFGYTMTFFIASQFFNLAMRMDLFLLSFFLSKSAEVGYYGLAQKIILTIIASIASVTQVLSPNFSKIKTRAEIITEIKHSATYLLIPTTLFLILRFIPKQIFDLFFTEKYAEAIVVTRALSLPFILYVFLNLPTLFLLYTVKKPGYILAGNLAVFIIVTLGCYYLIPKLGMFGPPYALTFAFLTSLVIMTTLSIREFNKIT